MEIVQFSFFDLGNVKNMTAPMRIKLNRIKPNLEIETSHSEVQDIPVLPKEQCATESKRR